MMIVVVLSLIVQPESKVFSLAWDPLLVDHEEQVVSCDCETGKMGGFNLKRALVLLPALVLLLKRQLDVLVPPCPVVGDRARPQESNRADLVGICVLSGHVQLKNVSIVKFITICGILYLQ